MLSHLSTVSDPGEDAWVAHFQLLRSVPRTYYTIVIIDTKTDRIVATGTIYIERKFLRGLGAVGHFEDVVVDRSQRGGQLGLCIANVLVGISEGMGCFKTTGNCLDHNMGECMHATYVVERISAHADTKAFYEKTGAKRLGCMMVRQSLMLCSSLSWCPEILSLAGQI